MAKEKFYTSERNVQIVLSLLKANGIRKIIASPGATNFTFVGSVQNDPFFEVYSAVDERSAAYMACGMAAESGEAVALSCTGATASRNYYPGLTEAFYRKLPVLAITSHQGTDRIGQLIPQNIDRRILPNDIARLSVELPVVKDCRDEDYVVMEVNKAMLELRRNGGGPVHINLITTYSRDFSVKELPHVKVMRRFQAWDELPVLPEGRIGIYVGSHTHFSEKQNRAIDRFCATYDATTKEEFMTALSNFTNPQLSDHSMILEVFTDSKDESEALYLMSHIQSDAKGMVRSKLKDAVRNVAGEKGINAIKKILKK